MRSHSKTRSYDAPNFEKPADADKDNVYEVTITATDGNANMATRDGKGYGHERRGSSGR